MLPFLAPLALKLSPVGAALKRVPRGVWIGLAVILAAAAVVWWHFDKVSDARKDGYAAGVKDEAERIAAKAFEIKSKADALTHSISTKLRSKSDETNRRIAGDAGALLVRGPGKASCPGNPSVSNSTSGHVAPARPSDVAVDSVPDGERVELIALPFAPTIAFGRQHDQCQADLKSYREWEMQIREAWARIER